MPTYGALHDVETYRARRLYPMSSAAAPLAEYFPDVKIWQVGRIYNQGAEPKCVAYSGMGWMSCEPNPSLDPMPKLHPTVDRIYAAAQSIDGYSVPHDGTTVRALVSTLQAYGKIGPYLWATSLSDVVQWLSLRGPAIVGMNWHEGMDWPDENGFLKPTGHGRGRHAILLNGVDNQKRAIHIVNSWGEGWGDYGTALISFEDIDRLLFSEGGECVGALESGELVTPVPEPVPTPEPVVPNPDPTPVVDVLGKVREAYNILGEILK